MQSLASLAPVLGLFGAVIGAVAGAWFTRRFRDPNPTILVDHLEIASTSTRGPDAVTVTNRELIIALEDDPFVGRPSRINSATVPESQYVTYLRDALKEIDEVIDHRLPTTKAVAQQLRDCLATDDYESFEKIWAQDQANLWLLLSIGVRWGDFSYPQEAPDLLSLSQFREWAEGGSKTKATIILSLPGAGRDIKFDWVKSSESEPTNIQNMQSKDVRECAERTANAFAYRVRDDLVCAVRFLLSGMRYAAPLRELRERVKKDLEAHNRLLLKGQITNTGGSPFAVLNNGSIFVTTAGYPYTKVESNGDKRPLRYPSNTQIRVLLAEDNPSSRNSPNLSYTSPVSIAPGTTSRFVAVSEKLLKDVDQDGVLLDAYKAGERDFYLGSWAILPGRKPQRPQYTTPQLFRDWEAENEVPPRPTRPGTSSSSRRSGSRKSN